MNTVLESVVFRTQSLGGFLVLALFVGVAVMKGIAYPVLAQSGDSGTVV